MEIKINREIREYHESMFMGLSLRQSVFSVLAIASAVGLYFWLNPILGTEAVSWICVLGAAPFAVLGFVSYHGMPAEKFIWVWFRSEVLEPKQLCFQPININIDTSGKPVLFLYNQNNAILEDVKSA